MDEIEIRFTEHEVAKILWVLTEASELAAASDALSSLALIEEHFEWCATGSTAGIPCSQVS